MDDKVKDVENAEENDTKTVDQMRAEFTEAKKENKILGFLKSHKKAILIGVGAAVGTAVLATLANKAKEDPELVADIEPEENESTSEPVTEDKTEE